MKVVGLISGGKDSCFNLQHCIANGHELVALANLFPPVQDQDELDSYMYQTVGHDNVHLIAECLELPLYRQPITGTPIIQTLSYRFEQHDETEDLDHLIAQVKAHHPDVEAISVGAVLSNYQRIRVEHIALRHGLTCLAYLWERDQISLLAEMIEAETKATLIKVAGIGLSRHHLGKDIAEMQPTLLALHNKYGLHVCGEGGEYETFVLDCPIFKGKRIVVDESRVVEHSTGDVYYLSFKAHTVLKPSKVLTLPTRPAMLQLEEDGQGLEAEFTSCMAVDANLAQAEIEQLYFAQSESHGPLEAEFKSCMASIQAQLDASQFTLRDIVQVMLILSDMANFSHINRVYDTYFSYPLPPARVCIASNLIYPHRIQVYVLASHTPRRGLHIQSRSYWAPANIGPYSQSIVIGSRIYIAGQIGLDPATSTLIQSQHKPHTEAFLAMQHLLRIAETMKTTHISAMLAYYTPDSPLESIVQAWNNLRHALLLPIHHNILFLCVSALPRNAHIEWHALGCFNSADDDALKPYCLTQSTWGVCHSRALAQISIDSPTDLLSSSSFSYTFYVPSHTAKKLPPSPAIPVHCLHTLSMQGTIAHVTLGHFDVAEGEGL